MRRVLGYGGSAANRVRRLAAPAQLRGADKIHLGAGFRQMPGWANIDLSGDNIIWDLTKPLPVKPGSVRFAYSEHFIEHITRGDALKLLTNVRQALAPVGVVRLSTPDLATWVKNYSDGNLVGLPSHEWNPETLCQMVNDTFHEWGHRFIYDEPELSNLLRMAGFRTICRMRWRESDYVELAGLETRADLGDLIVEAA
jgi:predicted SAM-dependent methyltransferase